MKELIKVSSISIGLCGILMVWNDHVLPGIIVLSIACLGGMLYSSKNVVGN
jgi:hypothetical protein